MNEQERQRRIAQLKLQERKLRQEGKYDEAAQLFGKYTFCISSLFLKHMTLTL